MFGDDKMKTEPTKRQMDVYNFIVAYITKNMYSPSVRDICKAIGINSTSAVWVHLEALKRWGLIDYQPAQTRSIVLKGYKLVKE